MRTLDPIIARFVDDLLALVEEAAADGLRTLLAEETRHRRTRRLQGERVPAAQPMANGAIPRPARPPLEPTRRPGAGRASADVAPPPAAAGEITDPQWLLAMGAPAPAGVGEADVEEIASASESLEGPASTVREVAARPPVRLRANETLARVSNAGVVIRRSR
ncbi:MAG: hypothetical protein ACLP1X_26310 [Polyangiaceae bacterium]|jgi:hypothetical protein